MTWEWGLTLLVINAMAAYLFAKLYCEAPDALQKLILVGVMLSSLALVFYYAMILFLGVDLREVQALALQNEHVAVLLYAFRLLYVRFLCQRPLTKY